MNNITIKDAIYSSLVIYAQVIRDKTEGDNWCDPYEDKKEKMICIAEMIEKELEKPKYKGCTFITV